MKKPLITIVTCTKNSEEFLEQCLHSVEIQTFTNYEHLIVDGFSTDKTLEIVNSYIKRNKNKNIRVVQSEPKGISNAMNVAIANATGEIIHFVHSDDYYLNNTSVERAMKYFAENKKLTWLIGNVVTEFKDKLIFIRYNPILQTQFRTYMTMFNWIPHENTFVKKSMFKKYGNFNEDLKQSMDYEIWLRMLDKETPKLVDEDFTVFVMHQNSTTCNPRNWSRIAYEYLKIWKLQKTIPMIGSVKDSPIYISVKKITKKTKVLLSNFSNGVGLSS